MSQTPKYSIELLAPARDAAVAVAAINHGADAVYMGAPSHGARAAAGNPVADIAGVCDYAHRFNARVYVTVNTLVYPTEIKGVERMIGELYRAGVDALIVQDLGVLRMNIPPIELHASTQCDIRTPQRARFLQDLGFTQLVLPRELTLEEIRQIRSATTVRLEAFVHGTLCVSYSGDCRASLLCGGRSANRGECAQICRLPYDLIDGTGRKLIEKKHLLSLRDLNRLDDLDRLIEAGVSSLKIEGRLKDEKYVKNVVSAYDIRLHRAGVRRTADGTVSRTFVPDVNKSFNRGFTSHFINGTKPAAGTLASHDTPKSIGETAGVVHAVSGHKITLKPGAVALANGDGLNICGNTGFRVNKVISSTEFLTCEPVSGIHPGMTLNRNFDKAFSDILSPSTTATRSIGLQLTLRRCGAQLVLESHDGTAACMPSEPQPARTPQKETRRRIISKLGGTIYRVESLNDKLGEEFVAASVLTDLRHRFIATLEHRRAARFSRSLRGRELADAIWPEGTELSFHANVANDLAESVYRDHGVSGHIERALEVEPQRDKELEAMCMRYCLRRELGRCLKGPRGKQWVEPLTLVADGKPPMHLHFDCARCHMTMTI